MRGLTVSWRCFQNSSRDFLVRRRAEYSCTAISWRPVSWLLVRPDKYLYSFGRASSVLGVDLGNLVCACDMRLARTDEVSSGIGSSGFVE